MRDWRKRTPKNSVRFGWRKSIVDTNYDNVTNMSRASDKFHSTVILLTVNGARTQKSKRDRLK